MHEFYTGILAKFVLSFVATFLLVGCGWLFRRRKVENYQSSDAQAETTQEVHEPEPFRWYYVFFIILGALVTFWMLPLLAGSLLAICIVLVASQFFPHRRTGSSNLSRGEALRKLSSFLEELDANWERDGLDWDPDLLRILRAFVAEASKSSAGDRYRLEGLRIEVHAYFERYKSMKGISYVREWVDIFCETRDNDVDLVLASYWLLFIIVPSVVCFLLLGPSVMSAGIALGLGFILVLIGERGIRYWDRLWRMDKD